MNPRSLRFQLLAWYTSLLVLAFAAVGLFLFFAVEQLLLQNLRELLARRVRQIAHLSAEAETPLTSEYLRGQIGALYVPETPESNARFVRVATETGHVLFQSGMPSDGSFDPRQIPLIPYKDEGFRVHNTGGQEVIVKTGRAETKAGLVIIEVGAAKGPIKSSVQQTLLSFLVAAPCLIAIATVGAYFLIGRALRSMVQLTESAEAISLHNVNERLPVAKTSDELETLSLALNRMIARIHDAVENTRRFIADASHELRTPLAVLRAELENVMSQKGLGPAERETLASNLEEVDRLGKIVQGLVALSRLDSGEAQTESVVFDLARVTSTTAEQMCLLAEDKGISFECAASEPALVRGDPARTKQVIVNLIDNAINYTPSGGRVQVRALAENSHAILQILDNGIGIPKSAQPHIFERFYRVDKARSREMGGAGLGLSIVKSICSAHSAEIQIESAEGVGTNIRVIFPRWDSAD